MRRFCFLIVIFFIVIVSGFGYSKDQFVWFEGRLDLFVGEEYVLDIPYSKNLLIGVEDISIAEKNIKLISWEFKDKNSLYEDYNMDVSLTIKAVEEGTEYLTGFTVRFNSGEKIFVKTGKLELNTINQNTKVDNLSCQSKLGTIKLLSFDMVKIGQFYNKFDETVVIRVSGDNCGLRLDKSSVTKSELEIKSGAMFEIIYEYESNRDYADIVVHFLRPIVKISYQDIDLGVPLNFTTSRFYPDQSYNAFEK